MCRPVGSREGVYDLCPLIEPIEVSKKIDNTNYVTYAYDAYRTLVYILYVILEFYGTMFTKTSDSAA